jgi:outer membrane protein, multidrug efflux system
MRRSKWAPWDWRSAKARQFGVPGFGFGRRAELPPRLAGRRSPGPLWASALLAPLVLLAGCAIGPKYHRPPIAAPTSFRGESRAWTNSLGNLPWWEVFHDPTLQRLIRTALTNNYDLRIATTRVQQAQAVVEQARSQLFPQIGYGALAGRNRNAFPGGGLAPNQAETSLFEGDLDASWEIDLWGRIRRLTESARAQYFATEEARHDITTSILAQVAQGYFELLELDRQLAIAEDATNSFGQSYDLFNLQLQGGVASKLETSSAAALLGSAAATIPDIRRQIALAENQLSVLLGENPRAIARAGSSMDQQWPPDVPAGLPSALLERRPDIREAEQQLRSANAQVGVAEANFLPQLNLTGLLGRVSPELEMLTAGSTTAWSVAADVTGPLFRAGQLIGQYRQAKAARDQYALQYHSTVLNAFQEVSNALITREQLAEAQAQQANAVAAYREATRIAIERYRHGQSSYFEVLQEQQLLFPAEHILAQTQYAQLSAIVQLYRALGGGWGAHAP